MTREIERTPVCIVGAGPAGLVLGHLLERRGIETVVLESQSREHIESRVRAGVLEQGTVELLVSEEVGERLGREGITHHGIELRFDGRGHRIAFDELTDGCSITIYGQQEVVKDLVEARLQMGAPLLFEAEVTGLEEIDGPRPRVRYTHEGAEHEVSCEFIAGCDGFHGPCRETVPAGELSFYEREEPFAWLGILAEVAPSTEELIYARHERGFALHSLRSPELSRLYVQCDAGDELEQWPDERIWEELHLRLARDDGWELKEGPIVEKGIAGMRGFVTEPMQHGRLFLAGDAVHIVPATGAKGLNLAVADVRVLASALLDHYREGDDQGLRNYSRRCLGRIWRSQHFASWMTSMLHRYPASSGFDDQMQRAQLEYVCASEAAARTLAENYVGVAPVLDQPELGMAAVPAL